MQKVLDLINSNDIKNVENIELPIDISTDKLIYKLKIKNKLIFYSNPVLDIKLKTDNKIDLNKILKCVELKIAGEVINKLTKDEINEYQNKYNLMPKQFTNNIIFPIPIECLNNKNGIFIPKETFYENLIEISFAMDVSKIMSCSLNIENIFLNEDADLSNLMNYYYNEIMVSNIHCDKQYFNRFISYCNLIKNNSDVTSVHKNKYTFKGVKKIQEFYALKVILSNDFLEIHQMLYFLNDVISSIDFVLNNVDTGKSFGEEWFDETIFVSF